MSDLPIILFNLDNDTIPINSNSKSNTYFIRSYQNFSIEIIEDSVTDNFIYSVKRNLQPIIPTDLFIIEKQKSFVNNNFSYTIFLNSNVIIRVTGIDNISKLYYINYLPDNIIDETNQHYTDLLVNNHLPSFEELSEVLIDENKAELLKRLLLDFKNIINKKGTKTGITKFLNLIGFNPASIKVYEEYLIISNKQKTLTPNKEKDIKTGYYHVLYDNWIVDENDKLTIKNLPKRIININDLEEFFEKLYKSIVLANIYFTLPEQDISFFGLSNSVNIEKYLSIAGNTSVLHYSDFHYFRKNIKINLINFVNRTNKLYLVNNNIQYISETFNNEIKIYSSDSFPLQNNQELFLVEREIFDNEINTDIDELKIKSIFGNLLNLKIESSNVYCEYIIEDLINPMTKIISNKFFLNDFIELNIVSRKTGNYKITILIYDIHNNREKYTYFYSVKNSISRIDFNIYNSVELSQNNLNQDIDSTSEVIQENNNFILPLNLIPLELSEYYNNSNLSFVSDIKYLTKNKRYILPSINNNFVVDNITEIPVDYIDNYLSIITYKNNPDYLLKILVLNEETLIPEYLDYNLYNSKINNLFITGMQIYNPELIENLENHVFISTTEIGINLTQDLYDLVLININDETDILSIYDLPPTFNSVKTKIPVNYDFPLFHIQNNFITNYPVIDINEPIIIESIFPKLNNIKNIIPNIDNYYLKLGDVIVCNINENSITEIQNIIWTIKNSFTKQIIYQSNDYSLKYRIKENIIYDIILEFEINGDKFKLEKNSVQSTFILN